MRRVPRGVLVRRAPEGHRARRRSRRRRDRNRGRRRGPPAPGAVQPRRQRGQVHRAGARVGERASRTRTASRSPSRIPASGFRTTARRRYSSASSRPSRVRPAASAAAGSGSRYAGRWSVAMGGEIRLESEPGEGSVFHVVLPWRVGSRARDATLAGQRVADPDRRTRSSARRSRRGCAAAARRCSRPRRSQTPSACSTRTSRSTRCWSTRGCPKATGSICSSGPRRRRRARALAPRRGLAADGPPGRRPVAMRGGRGGRVEQAGELGGAGAGAARRAPRAPRCRASPASAPSFAGRRILLVEDAPENRVIVQAHLRATGCDVEIAVDGEEAVEIWRRGEFDLVLMDLHMPRVDGVEAVRRIRAEEQPHRAPPDRDHRRHRRHRGRAARRLSRGGLRRPPGQAVLAGWSCFACMRRFLAASRSARGGRAADEEMPAQIPARSRRPRRGVPHQPPRRCDGAARSRANRRFRRARGGAATT